MFTRFLRKGQAVNVVVGPFVAVGDGFTPVSNTTLSSSGADDAVLFKQGGAAADGAIDISGRTFTAITNMTGYYLLSLTAADTDTVGPLTLSFVRTATHRPVRDTSCVVDTEVYDALFANDGFLPVDAKRLGGTEASGLFSNGGLQVDVAKIAGSGAAATGLGSSAATIAEVTVGSNSSRTLVTTDLTEATSDHYNGGVAIFTTGALAGQRAQILDYDGASKRVTLSQLTEAPASGDKFIIV